MVFVEPGEPLTPNGPVAELQVGGIGLEHVRGDDPGLLDHPLGGGDHRHPADHQRPRAVGVHAVRRRSGVAVDDRDVVRVDAEGIRGDLAPGGDVPLPVR
jgi:hypothetical protein